MKKWFNGLQCLRAILFIMVFVSHSAAFIDAPGHLGSFGVNAFFVLSGFLSALHETKENDSFMNLLKDSVYNVWKHIKKFYPLYFVFLLLAFPFRPASISNFIKCIFLIQSYFFDANVALSLNWPSWFLSSLLLCYFCAPIINRLLENKKKSFYIVLSIVLDALMIVWSYVWKMEPEAYGHGYYFVYIFPVARVVDFTIGSIMSFLFKKLPEKQEPNILDDGLECFTVILFFITITFVEKIPAIFSYTVIYLPVSYLMVWIFARERGFITRALTEFKPLISLGAISFELYIVHRIIIMFYAHFHTSILYWMMSIITTLLVAIMASNIMKYVNNRFVLKKGASGLSR